MFVYICGRLTVSNPQPRRTKKNVVSTSPETTDRGRGCCRSEIGSRWGQAFFHVIVLKGSHRKSSTTLGVCWFRKSSICSRIATKMHLIPRMFVSSSTLCQLDCMIESFMTRVYNKTLEYVKTFAKFNTTDSASAVREYVADLAAL